MAHLNYKTPIILVPTILLGVGALAYGLNSFFSSPSSSNQSSSNSSSRTNYSTSESPVVNNSPRVSYDSQSSNGANFINPMNSSYSSSGGSRKKKKRRSKSKSKSR